MKCAVKIVRFLILMALIMPWLGCEREHPLTFAPIDLDQFSRNLRGFNLLGKYDVDWSNNGFQEEEFAIIKDLGFNFARLPLDYRTYTQPGNWDVFIEDEVAEIDQAVEWGKKYGVHICIDLHRAPGYCVNPTTTLPSNQNLDLWTDSKAQDAFLKHWSYFAERYKDVPYKELSFDLVNEPKDMDEGAYVKVMQKAIAKIQEINPDRVIFVDGLNYARKLIPSLKNEKDVIQAIHVYDPITLTHYKASWVSGSDSWPLPTWPMLDISQFLFGPWQSNYQSSLVLEGNFAKDATVTVNVQQVSVKSTMQIKLDGTEIYTKAFTCGPDPGEDWTQIINTQWGYQNISGKDYSTALPADGTKLTFSNTEGDWLTFNKITIKSGSSEIVIVPANTEWGSKQATYKISSDGKITDTNGNPVTSLGPLRTTLETAKSEGIPIMVQEFGVYNKTPHEVALAYLNDIVSEFNKARIGYAMWNMIGSMGIINSERTDCTYEQYRGKLLDREMTSILQSTAK
ncbi:MAG: cellulase family glycosylhydrolase [Bacteroidota bacterium]|nr:cellulase family glycosylhydrolase [Bacteroidota bacterium]